MLFLLNIGLILYASCSILGCKNVKVILNYIYVYIILLLLLLWIKLLTVSPLATAFQRLPSVQKPNF